MTETSAAERRPAKFGMVVILILGMTFMLILAGLLSLGGRRPERTHHR